MSYTYAVLDVSPAVFEEVKTKLKAAGYDHAFDGDVIDMHGIALKMVVPPLRGKDVKRKDGPRLDGREKRPMKCGGSDLYPGVLRPKR